MPLQLSDIQIRDPFVLPLPEVNEYLLLGSTDLDIWSGPATGLDCYRSSDLVSRDGPVPAFRLPPGFWSHEQFWAPEVHRYPGGFFMFAIFSAPGHFRDTQILSSVCPEGPTHQPNSSPHERASFHYLKELEDTVVIDPPATGLSNSGTAPGRQAW